MSPISNQNWLVFTNYYDNLGKRMRGFQVELRDLYFEQLLCAKPLHRIKSMHRTARRF